MALIDQAWHISKNVMTSGPRGIQRDPQLTLTLRVGVSLFKSHSFCWIRNIIWKPLTVQSGSHGSNLPRPGHERTEQLKQVIYARLKDLLWVDWDVPACMVLWIAVSIVHLYSTCFLGKWLDLHWNIDRFQPKKRFTHMIYVNFCMHAMTCKCMQVQWVIAELLCI